MIRSLCFDLDAHQLKTNLTPAEYATVLADSAALLWVDFENEPLEIAEPILRDTFGFHPLAVDDAVRESHVPKVDDWSDYLYIVMHAIAFDPQEIGDLDTKELDVFLGRNYLVTHHADQISAIERVWDLCHRDERHWRNGVDHLFYKVADELVESYMPVVEIMDEEIERIEDIVFGNGSAAALQDIFGLKRAAVTLRRIIGPQRETINKLARDEYAVIDVRTRIYFRDVYDHLVRMHDITESIRDLISSTLDSYLSVINNRMNEVMKTLTIITTLFMPLTFLTGFFGMNFFAALGDLPAWTSMPVFILVLLVCLFMPLAMFIWMRRRGWMKKVP